MCPQAACVRECFGDDTCGREEAAAGWGPASRWSTVHALGHLRRAQELWSRMGFLLCPEEEGAVLIVLVLSAGNPGKGA